MKVFRMNEPGSLKNIFDNESVYNDRTNFEVCVNPNLLEELLLLADDSFIYNDSFVFLTYLYSKCCIQNFILFNDI